MKNSLRIVFFSLATCQAFAQDTLTTFILVRHAEKEVAHAMPENRDPDLSVEGIKRAERLAEIFSRTTIDAIYSTPFIRTKKTVEPLSKLKSTPVREYEPNNPDVINKIWTKHRGKTILLCGHSNTIPKIAGQLTKSGSYQNFDDKDYGNILVITLSSSGKSSSLIWLRY